MNHQITKLISYVLSLLLMPSLAFTSPAKSAKEVRADLDSLSKKFSSLNRKCQKDKDCFSTKTAPDLCPALCNGCGETIHRKDRYRFESLKRRAAELRSLKIITGDTIELMTCEEAMCAESAPISCAPKCIDGLCRNK